MWRVDMRLFLSFTTRSVVIGESGNLKNKQNERKKQIPKNKVFSFSSIGSSVLYRRTWSRLNLNR
jgi:hypothetical protein